MQDHGRPDDGTLQFSWVNRSALKTRRTNDQRKISLSSFTFYALEFVRKIPTPPKSRDASITRGLSRMTTNPDILFTRPLRTLETKGATYRHKALSKTGRTSKPHAPIATMFLFTRKIMLKRLSRLWFRRPPFSKKGSKGSAYSNQVAQVN